MGKISVYDKTVIGNQKKTKVKDIHEFLSKRYSAHIIYTNMAHIAA